MLQAVPATRRPGRSCWDIRLPRTLGAWLAGALLGLAGAVAQGLFRNPLADPYSAGQRLRRVAGRGAGAGAVRRLARWRTHWLARLGLTGAAFVGAVAAVLLTLALARGVQHTLRLLLAGVIVGVVLGALGSLVTLLVPETSCRPCRPSCWAAPALSAGPPAC